MMSKLFCAPRLLFRPSRRLVFAALLFSASLGFAAVPDWLRTAAALSTDGYDKEIRAVKLLDEQTTTVRDSGETVTLHHVAIKVLRPSGRDEALVPIFFDKETRLNFVHVWTITATGKEYELKEKDLLESSPYEGELYQDTRLKFAQPPGLEPGTIVGYEYEQKQRPYLLDEQWRFQSSIPVKVARYTLRLPPGWEYKVFWAHYPSLEPSSLGNNQWTWELKDISAIEEEPSMPAAAAVAGRMLLTYFGELRGGAWNGSRSWNEFGKWYYNLTAGRRDPSPEIQQKVAQLTANVSDPLAKIRALTGFMQNEIRYVAIEIGIGGYQPHSAAEIFHNRYGDCKDKVTLLSSMLHQIGIESNYLLVHTDRGAVVPEAPANQFDHVVLAIRPPEKTDTSVLDSIAVAKDGTKYLIFDPTDRFTPLGELASDEQGSYGLLVTDKGGEMIQLPQLKPQTNRLRRVAHLKLMPDGTLNGEVEETRSGDHASSDRARLLGSSDSDRTKALDHFLGTFLNGFSVQNSRVENLDHFDQDLVIRYSFTANAYAKKAGSLLLVRPRVLGSKVAGLGVKPRKYPFEFSATSQQTDIFELEVPPDYEIEELPDPIQIDVGFANYQSKTEFSNHLIRYSRDYTIKDLEVPVDHISDLKKLYSYINQDERNSVVLKKRAD